MSKKTDEAVKVAANLVEDISGPRMARLADIRADMNQPRKVFPIEGLKTLAASIGDMGMQHRMLVRFVPAQFVLEEPDLTHQGEWLVRKTTDGTTTTYKQENLAYLANGGAAAFQPYYELIDGERRWRAARMVPDLEMVPVDVRRAMPAEDKFKIQHVVNDQREGLTPLDEGESFYRAVMVDKLFSAEDLAKELGLSKSHVYGRIKLAQLPGVVKEAVAGGKLNAALAELVAKVPGEKNQLAAMKEIMEGGGHEYPPDAAGDLDYDNPIQLPMSVRQAKRHLQEHYTLELEDAVFDVKDAKLVPEAGACAKCPKRSGNCPDLFPELKNPNVCTDPDCFETKRQTHLDTVRAATEDTGVRVLTVKESKGYMKYGDFDPYKQKSVKALTEEVPGDKKKRSYKELLGKDAVAQVAVVDEKGKVHKFYPKAELAAQLTIKGFAFKDPDAREVEKSETPEEKAAKEARKTAMLTIADEQRPKIVTALLKMSEGDFLRAMMPRILNSWDARNTLKRCGLKCKEGRGGDVDMAAVVEKLDAGDLRLLLVESRVHCAENAVSYSGEWSEAFLAFAGAVGVDLEALEKAAMPKVAETTEGTKGTKETKAGKGKKKNGK